MNKAKMAQNEKMIGLVLIGLGALVFIGIFGSLNPFGCSGSGFTFAGFFFSLFSLSVVCNAYNQLIGLGLIVIGTVIYILGVRR